MKNNAKRRERERQELRLRMLDAARDLFLAGGEEAVTLRRVAENIEYSATTIYLYFPSKESLIQALCRDDFGVFSRHLKQAERTPDPILRLRKIASAYIDFGLQNPRQYRAMFMPPRITAQILPVSATRTAGDPDEQSAAAVKGGSGFSPSASLSDPYDFIYGAVFKAMAAGCFRPEHRDVPLVAQVIWSGLHGVVSLHLVRAGFSTIKWCDTQTTAQTMVETLLGGLLRERPGEQ